MLRGDSQRKIGGARRNFQGYKRGYHTSRVCSLISSKAGASAILLRGSFQNFLRASPSLIYMTGPFPRGGGVGEGGG